MASLKLIQHTVFLALRFGFTKIGTIPAFLKVNGEDFASDYMVLPLKNNA